MKHTKRLHPGFTIVELLVVIVVIGILASITIVAYNGVQARAGNAKTVSAASAWIKGILNYNTVTGQWPNESCLGNSNTYASSGGVCAFSTTVSTTFLSQMQPYMSSSFPEPDTTPLDSSDPDGPYRGIFYEKANQYKSVDVFLSNTNACPDILGLPKRVFSTIGNGVDCQYVFAGTPPF
jgi:prepilin-type N-terminal cleavage/methylation domain-containing protein